MMEEQPQDVRPGENNGRETNTARDYFRLGPVFGYFFRRKDPNRPSNFNIKMMHGINKLSMLMFLICLIVLLFRYVF